MDSLQNIRRLFSYDRWANRETVRVLKTIQNPPQKSLDYLAHILGAEYLWLLRLQPDGSKVVVWPKLTVSEAEKSFEDLERRWDAYLARLDLDLLESMIEYVNSKGEPWSSRVEDVLIHVVIHSAQHRGQIASNLRAEGFEPPYTDFIHSVRQGKL
jgi:uncharacterized damage-inducible protein DinB